MTGFNCPTVVVKPARRDHYGDEMTADVCLDGEQVAIATKALDAPMPSWLVRFETPDAPAWLRGTVERDTIRDLRLAVREHVEDSHRRMVDEALAEACHYAAERAALREAQAF